MSQVDKDIEAGLILYLKEQHQIIAGTAQIEGYTEAERGYGGCDTCGYGRQDTEITHSVYITYTEPGRSQFKSINFEVENVLSALPLLLPYIDRARESK